MVIGKGMQKCLRKSALVPFCPPQIPHARNLAFSVRCEWHMAQAMSQPCHCEVTHPCNQVKMFSIFLICYILMYEFQMKINRLEGI